MALFWQLGAMPAAADTLTLAQYRARLVEVRALVQQARTAPSFDRFTMSNRARDLLLSVTALQVGRETIAVDPHALADRMNATPDGLAAFLDDLDLAIALVDRSSAGRIDPAAADATLAGVLGAENARAAPSLVEALIGAILRFLAGLPGPRLDTDILIPVVGILGLAVVAFVVAVLGRDLRHRVRAEVLLQRIGGPHGEDPAAHLRAAESAIAAGHARDAVHELYLYAIGSLAAREAIRYDPSLTDRELLLRAAGIPHAEALHDLVGLYQRAWFGLQEPDADDAARARSLALRVTG